MSPTYLTCRRLFVRLTFFAMAAGLFRGIAGGASIDSPFFYVMLECAEYIALFNGLVCAVRLGILEVRLFDESGG